MMIEYEIELGVNGYAVDFIVKFIVDPCEEEIIDSDPQFCVPGGGQGIDIIGLKHRETNKDAGFLIKYLEDEIINAIKCTGE